MPLEIKVKTNGHANRILQDLNRSRKETRVHCDFMIIAGSEEIPVHKNIISVGSDYFRAMLAHNNAETASGKVEMKEVDPLSLQQCVEYIYTGELSTTDENAESLMYVAELLQLKDVGRGIVDSLEENLEASTESFFVTKRIANLYNYKEFMQKCEKFMLDKFGEIAVLDEFKEIEEKQFVRLIKSQENKASESVKLKAFISWIKHEQINRKKLLKKLNNYIDLHKVPVTYRRFLVENEPMVKSCPECYQALCISVMDSLNVDASDIHSAENIKQERKEAIAVFDENSKSLQCFNPRNNTWTKMQNLPGSELLFSAVALGDYIYVLMGDQSVHRLKYSDHEATWERMNDMMYSHGNCPPVAVLPGNLYVVGSFGAFSSYSKSVEKFEPSSNKWEKVKDKNLNSRNSTALGAGGCIYSIGGYISGRYTNQVERFDPTSSTWSFVASMNEAKGWVAAVENEGKIYVLGGWANGHLTTVERYDISTNVWSTVTPMLTKRSWFSAFVIDSNIYAVGGKNSSPGSIEKFDFTKNQWEMIDIKNMNLKIVNAVKINLK
uniref:kelch-like protein 28 n=1 Tax=Styela clava TaxID=7725 RepID=UPI00193A8A5A|nr:kelch-like protein 28 [Styela clava]